MDTMSATDIYDMEFSNITDLLTTRIPERIDSSSPWGPSRDPLYLVVPMTVLYSLIFVTGLVGNISTCIVIYRNRSMQTTTNLYLFSMAVSDLLLLTSGLPQEVYILWSKYPYIFGEVCCFLQGLISEASSNATVLTITAFTVERYIAICHPFLSHTVSKASRAVKFIIFIWLMAFLSAIPQAIQFGLVYATDNKGNVISEEYKLCSVKTRTFKHSFELSAVLFFFFPMSVITVLYILIGIRLHRAGDSTSGSVSRGSRKGNAKSNKRVIKMLVVVVVAFFICWAPFQAQRLFAMQAQGKHNSPRMVFFYQCITYISGPLYYLSTTVNPFLYNIMSLKFRAAFKEITRCRFETRFPKHLTEYTYAKAVHRIGTTRCVTSTLSRCLNGRQSTRCELSSECRGPRHNYSVLSQRSARGGQSVSSGNSFVEAPDINRRPLVFNFRRAPNCPEQRELLEPPRACSRYSPGQRRLYGHCYSPSPMRRHYIRPVEDIEIFQEVMALREESCPPERSPPQARRMEVAIKKSFTVPCLNVR